MIVKCKACPRYLRDPGIQRTTHKATHQPVIPAKAGMTVGGGNDVG